MVTKFNTAAPSSGSSSSGSEGSTGSGNGTLKTVLIVGLIALAGYGLYRYFKKKNETVVYVDETDDY
jgi:hypothetical protein